MPSHHIHTLVLKVLVDLEEVHDFLQGVRADLVDASSIAKSWVVLCDAQNLLIRPLFITHLENADGDRFHQTTRKSWVPDHDEHVERVPIKIVSLGNESVIERIKKRGIQNAIELEEARFWVPFVLVRASARNFNDGVYDFWRVWPNFCITWHWCYSMYRSATRNHIMSVVENRRSELQNSTSLWLMGCALGLGISMLLFSFQLAEDIAWVEWAFLASLLVTFVCLLFMFSTYLESKGFSPWLAVLALLGPLGWLIAILLPDRLEKKMESEGEVMPHTWAELNHGSRSSQFYNGR